MRDKPLYTETTFRVRFAETDQMGIVHHATYIVYLEEGRSALGREHGVPYAALEDMGYSLAVSEVQARFAAAARYDEAITVQTWLEKVGSRGLTFGYRVAAVADDRQLVTATTKHICVDHDGKVSRLPEAWIGPLREAMG